MLVSRRILWWGLFAVEIIFLSIHEEWQTLFHKAALLGSSTIVLSLGLWSYAMHIIHCSMILYPYWRLPHWIWLHIQLCPIWQRTTSSWYLCAYSFKKQGISLGLVLCLVSFAIWIGWIHWFIICLHHLHHIQFLGYLRRYIFILASVVSNLNLNK